MKFEEIPNLKQFNKLITNNEDKVLPLSDIANKNPDRGDRFSTGFNIFDKAMSGGFKDGDLVVISGISGEGKTTVAQTLTYNLCLRNIPCLWFTYEVTHKELDKKFKEMNIKDFYYVYSPAKNTTGKIEWIKEKIKESWIKYNTKVVFIDHLDFLTPSTVKTLDSETQALKRITTELKELAIELNIIIVLMAHLKKLENNKEPEMQDIANSAGIFQLADYVFMVFRERNKQYKSFRSNNTEDVFTNNSILKLVKNRQTGQLKFLKIIFSNGRFMQLEEKQQEAYEPPRNY